jgi:ribosome-binding factor A
MILGTTMTTKKPFKREKFEEQLLIEINMFLRRELRDDRSLFVSVTKVEFNGDYSHAKVYWDTFDSSRKEEIDHSLKRMVGKARALLAKVLKVRHTPALQFIYDAQFESEMKITQILKEENEKLGHLENDAV